MTDLKNVPYNTVTARKINNNWSKWEIVYGVKHGLGRFALYGYKCTGEFDSREAVQIYCDMNSIKLVSLSEFNKLFNSDLLGDEC